MTKLFCIMILTAIISGCSATVGLTRPDYTTKRFCLPCIQFEGANYEQRGFGLGYDSGKRWPVFSTTYQ